MHSHQARLSAAPPVQPHLRSVFHKTSVLSVPVTLLCRHTQHQQQQHQLQQQHQPQPALSAQQPDVNANSPLSTAHFEQRSATADHRRRCVLVSAAAAALLLAFDGSIGRDAASASVPSSRAGDNVGFLTDSQVDKKRKKANFKRSHDGHVAILNRFSKQWTDVKCDLQVPGLLLLREASNQVFYLGYTGLKQVDLSDDMVVAAVAADDWENNMTLVQAETAAGGIEALEMTREEFYSLVSLVSSEDWTAGSSSNSRSSLGKTSGAAAAAAAASKAR